MKDNPKKKKQNTLNKQKPLKNSSLQKKSFTIPQWSIYAVIVFTALVYIRAIFNDFSDLDDPYYIFYNPYLKNFTFEGFELIFTSFYFDIYHPLTTITYMFEYHMYGLNPLPFHIFNILLHLANVFLVYKLTEKLSGKRFTALFVAVMFALHPMHVESVAWISERKDVLYTLFYLLSLIAYLRYIESDNKRHYITALLLFIASMLSKPSAITLFVLLFAIDIYKRRKINTALILEKIPFFILSILLVIITFLQPKTVGAESPELYSYSAIEKVFLFTYSISFYIVKLFAPFNLSAIHYFPQHTNEGVLPWFYYASLPFLLLLVWLVIRKTQFRHEKLFGAFFFLIVISIMLPILPIGIAITSERYTYVSYIGLFFIAGQWISQIQKPTIKKFIFPIIGVFLIIFSFLTWERISVWKDGNSLYTDIIKKYPNTYLPYSFRAKYRQSIKDYKGALQDFNRVIELVPTYPEGLNERSLLLIKEFKDYQAALKDINLSIKQDSTKAVSYNIRGMANDGLGDTAAALRDYDKAIALSPIFQKAYNNRGTLKAAMGNLPGALTDINKALVLNPDDGESYSNRANIKAMMNDFSGATEDYSTALKYNPKDDLVLFNRGLTRMNMGDTTGACEDWHKALEFGNETAKEVINQICRD